MLPYLEIRSIAIGPLRLPLQPLLAACGIMIAHLLFLRRARRSNLNPDHAAWLSLSMAVVGLAGAYLFRWAYLPGALARDPWIWMKTTAGASSFGGLAGGLLAAWLYFSLRRIDRPARWAYLDAMAFVFPLGWIFGRIGCSLLHDHPGVRSESWLAVAYPGFARYDLGVLEVFFLALLLIPAFQWLDRRPRPAGFFLGLFLSAYGLFRVILDQLHIDPPRRLGITIDQWAYGAAAIIGFAILWKALRRAPSSPAALR